MDHTQILGKTISEIAYEKAGIMKRNIPVIIGESNDDGLRQLFRSKAFEVSAPIIFSSQKDTLMDAEVQPDGSWIYDTINFGMLTGELRGPAQRINTQTVLSTLKLLANSGTQIRIAAVRKAFSHVTEFTGLMGRWQELSASPKVVCDIGHNPGAWESNKRQLSLEAGQHANMHLVLGFSNDKDVDGMLALMPQKATYYFTQAASQRAFPAEELANKGNALGLIGNKYPSVAEATQEALKVATPKDFIFIGGSTYIAADALRLFPDKIL
jgi:dihydrofolate synthase/folylpolyglutamate synthase